jgi:IMP dehydrogenase/GMP reductase
VAGVGFPQFSAVLEVAAALKGTGVPVIADGEFATQEIFLKQLLPVLTVMLGSLLAGTKESQEKLFLKEENLSLIAEWDLSKQWKVVQKTVISKMLKTM